jgi:hypothetical protein
LFAKAFNEKLAARTGRVNTERENSHASCSHVAQ